MSRPKQTHVALVAVILACVIGGLFAPPIIAHRNGMDSASASHELADRRWRTGKIYSVPGQPGTHRATIYGNSIHYEETPGDGVWLEIDPALENDGDSWSVTKNAWMLDMAKNYSADWPVTIQRRGGFTFQYKVAAAGHIAADRTVTLLQTAQASAGQLEELESGHHQVTFPNVFNGVDVVYRNDTDFLKQDIVISEQAKNTLRQVIQNRRLDPSGWLVFAIKVNLNDLGEWDLGLARDGETDQDINFDVPSDFLAHAKDRLAQVTVADEDGNTPDIKPRYRRINHPTHGTVLLMMVPLDWLAASIGTVTIDPTYYSSTSDGTVGNHPGSTSWSTVHDASSGTVANDSVNPYAFAMLARISSSGEYGINRSFFYFDTSAIPDDAVISAASLNLYFSSYRHSSISVQKGTQSSTLSTADFNNFAGDLYTHHQHDGVGYDAWDFDALGMSDIEKTGITKICAREHTYDYLNTAPGSTYYNGCYFADNVGTSKDPYLDITYEIPATPTPTNTPTPTPTPTPQHQPADPPGQITYQGHLLNSSSEPVPDGDYSMTFNLYDAVTGGSLLWGPEEHTVTTSAGYFSVLLGEETSITADVLASDTYLEVKVGEETLAPRHEFGSTPFTLITGTGTWGQNGSDIYYDGGNVGIRTANPQSALQVGSYIQFDTLAAAPPDVDCDDELEWGRMMVDAANDRLYVCVESGWSWVSLNQTP